MDAVIVIVLSEVGDFFTLKDEQKNDPDGFSQWKTFASLPTGFGDSSSKHRVASQLATGRSPGQQEASSSSVLASR